MVKRKDILYELEISCTILKTSINALAQRWDVSHTHVRSVARGQTKSARIREKIRQTILLAQKKVPFDTDINFNAQKN